MSQAPAHETLRRLFDVIVDEAQKDPTLAEKLAQAMTASLGAGPEARRPTKAQPFDASRVHAVNILRLHGEPALRGKLEQIKAADALRSVATASGLVLSGSAAKARASRAELIDGIIAAAKHYDAQRSAACE
jgi:hypothetical protein